MNSIDTSLKCVLVAEADRFCLSVILALIKNGIEIAEVWCEKPAEFEKPGFWSEVFSFGERKKGYAISAALGAQNTKVTKISKPYIEGLNHAVVQSKDFDILVCAGSNIIFPEVFLDSFKGKAFNLHPALLPAYRGPKPFHAMILHGTENLYGGMTLHLLSGEIDGGDVVGQKKVSLGPMLHSDWIIKVIDQSEALIRESLRPFIDGKTKPSPQNNDDASYFSKVEVPEFINERMSFVEAENFAMKAPLFMRHTIVEYNDSKNNSRKVKVYGAPRRIGSTSSQAAHRTMSKLEMDLIDCRVEFKINHKFRRYMKKYRSRFF